MGGGEGDEDLGDDVAAESSEPSATPEARPRLTRPPPDAKPRRRAERCVISMPEMGESVTEGTVLEWHVAEGERSPRATP